MDAKICDSCGKAIPIKHYNKIYVKRDAYYDGSEGSYDLCSDCFERILSEARAYIISLEVDENGVVKES